MAKYRKKPVEIEAIQWTGLNDQEIENFVGKDLMGYDTYNNGKVMYIATLEGSMRASINDYIIKGIKGEFYPCKPKIFEETYDLIS